MNEEETRAYCRQQGIHYKKGMQILPTREMKPLNEAQRKAYKAYVKKYRGPIEEPLPQGASLRNPSVMDLVFRSLVLSKVIG